jgi:soluble lytic murein transglycosylase
MSYCSAATFRVKLVSIVSIRNLFLIFVLLSLLTSSGLAQQSSVSKKTVETTTNNSKRTSASKKKSSASAPAKKSSTSSKKTSAAKSKKASASAKTAAARKREHAAVLRRLRRMNTAFVASNSLKPMARQLLQNRTRAAYAGVESFAVRHGGTDAGAMAYLDIGYAHILDHDYAQAIPPLKKAHLHAGDLGDYADYFLATAYGATAHPELLVSTLKDFGAKYPDSLFLRDAMVIYGNALVAAGRPQEALAVLAKYRQPQRADVELAIGRAYLKLGDSAKAAETLSHLYYTIPLAAESSEARADLDSLTSAGLIPPASFADRKQRADLLAEARRFADAAREYRALLNDAPPDDRPAIQAALGMALHRSGNDRDAHTFLDSMADSAAEYDAQKLLALAEMARNADDEAGFTNIVSRLRQNHASSNYFGDALLLGGNMYLLKRDLDHAIDYFRELQQRFPTQRRASYAHWKAAWLSLRQGRNEEAKKLFEEQVDWYPTSPEVPAALYWRARLAEEDHDSNKARQYYEKLADNFRQYYYADLARTRLAQLGSTNDDPPADPILEKLAPPVVPSGIVADTPVDDLRVQKSRLLDNAGMTDFSVRELRLAASDGGAGWANREIARVFTADARYDRALQTLKRAIPSYYALEISALPRDCWEMLFPRPYWTELKKYSVANGLDPFLVAALIRQESEFNPSAMSNANAYGLMQLLPATGRTVARGLKVRGFATGQLLSPVTNMQLGTRYFRDLVDRYNGRYEYALAAYNAGADRVDAWLANGPYRDPQEFVESIPFTETREYVQAIMRNASVYRKLYGTP